MFVVVVVAAVVAALSHVMQILPSLVSIEHCYCVLFSCCCCCCLESSLS